MGSRSQHGLRTAAEILLERSNESREERTATIGYEARALRSELIARYGHGDEPTYRLRCYDKICDMYVKFGDCVKKLVRDLEYASSGKKHPDRYFIHAMMKESEKRGWLTSD